MQETTLKEKILEFSKEMAKNAPPSALQTIGVEIEKLAAGAQAERALKKGAHAKNFTLKDSEGNEFHLQELLKRGSVVLKFNRGSWCPFCNLEMKALSDALTDIKAAGGQLIMLLPQFPEKSATTKKENGFKYPMLHDAGNHIAKEYGLVFSMPAVLQPIHTAFQMNVPDWNSDGSWDLPFPATYVIDPTGKIVYSYINSNWMERPEPKEIINVLKSIK